MDLSGLLRRRRRRAALGSFGATIAILAAGLSAGANTMQEPARITRQAYFTHPLTQVTPPLITEGFPPGTACLVAGLIGAPQVCGTEVQDVGGLLGLSDGLPIPVSPDGEIAQPVAPGTTPVGMLGGQQRYTSLLQIALPTLPDGQGFGSVELVMHQGGLNFAVESPALRAVVLAAIGQVGEQDPEKLVDDLTQALTSGELATDSVTGIEACPAVEPWVGGDAQGAAADGTRLPDTDCLIGTTGVHDAAAGTWTFDLTFAAQAWTEAGAGGEPLPNEGIVLRPVGAPNLAYGDPDVSTNWVVSLADGEAAEADRPLLRYSTVALAPDDAVPPAGTDGFDPGLGSPFEPDFDPLPVVPGNTPPAVSLGGTISARYAERASTAGDGYLPGWVWLALPFGAVGSVLFAQSLTASPAASRRRPGALSKLVATNESLHPTPSPRS
ncbi:MAG: hypothetical protein ACRDZU_13065 [Acidimicrobiales bacterium]